MLGPPDGASRRLGQPTARRTPDDGIAKGTVRIPDRGDGADPRAIGELLQTWIGVKLDEVDGLVPFSAVERRYFACSGQGIGMVSSSRMRRWVPVSRSSTIPSGV